MKRAPTAEEEREREAKVYGGSFVHLVEGRGAGGRWLGGVQTRKPAGSQGDARALPARKRETQGWRWGVVYPFVQA